jgi:O-antigen/teichoic acid export membrane protein
MNILSKLKGDFAKSVMTLVTGTVLSQIIVLALSPIISRLYTPEESANFSIYMRIILFVSTIATARFESALALPKRIEHAFSLYRLLIQLIIISFFSSIFIVALMALFWTKESTTSFILLMVPLGFAPLCLMNIGNNWGLRNGEFREVSKVRMLNSLSMNLSNILFGFLGLGYKGLIFGFIVGVILPASWFSRKYHLLKLKFKDFSLNKRKRIIGKTYLEFPKVNLPHAIIDITREILIVFFILLYYDKITLGSYDFSFKMLKLPLTVLGSAIGQVYFQKIANKKNNGESLFGITLETIRNLFLFSIIPFGVLFFIGDDLFAFVFGENWRKAGEYSQIMAPWLMLNLIVSPISQLPIVVGKLKMFFWIGLIGSLLLISFLNLPLISEAQISFENVLKWVNWTQFAFMLFVLIWMIKLVKTSTNDIVK